MQLLGHHPSIGLHYGDFVSLIEGFQLCLGSFAGSLGLFELRSKLVEGDEPFGKDPNPLIP